MIKVAGGKHIIRDSDGADGWELMSEFLKKIVKTVNNHTSTLGYEILNEPQIHNDDQWEKVGEFNTFMVKELRELTQKTIVFSQQMIRTILYSSSLFIGYRNPAATMMTDLRPI